MIPKTIHYCWFGRNPLPPLAKKCIASWKKYCPDYEIIEWNEDNFDINSNQYIKEAYESKKWAFVTDYVRLYVLEKYGGVYMDTDVEVVKPIDEFLRHSAFSGFEDPKRVPTGIMASEKSHPIIQGLLSYYSDKHFIGESGEPDTTTNVQIITNMLLEKGLVLNGELQDVEDFVLYPSDYFCPKDYSTGMIKTTSRTYTIHHFNGSWHSESQAKYKRTRWSFFEELSKSSRFQKRHGNLSQSEQEQKMKEIWLKKVNRAKRRNVIIERMRSIPRKMLRSIIGDQKYEQLKARIKK